MENKNLTNMLSEEHKHILKVVNALNRECDAIGDGKKLDKEFFSKAVDFIRNYADKYHHAKEEDILFAELNKNEERMHCNPVPQMVYEHEQGRSFVKGLEESLKRNDKEGVLTNGKNYAALLQDHIFKEDNILYPLADEALTKKDQLDMLKRAEEANQKLGYEKKYLLLAQELEKRK